MCAIITVQLLRQMITGLIKLTHKTRKHLLLISEHVKHIYIFKST